MNQANLDLPLRPPTRVAYIHGAVMTGISLRLAWHSFRPSPLGVQGDIALSVLGWVDAKCTPIDMSSLVEPSNQCQPNPNWCHPGSPCTEHVSRLVSLLRLFGRFNSVSISAVSVAVAFSPSYCHVHNIPRLLERRASGRHSRRSSEECLHESAEVNSVPSASRGHP